MEEQKQYKITMPVCVTHNKVRQQTTEVLFKTREHFDLQIEHWQKYRDELTRDGYDVDSAISNLETNKRVISEVLDERHSL